MKPYGCWATLVPNGIFQYSPTWPTHHIFYKNILLKKFDSVGNSELKNSFVWPYITLKKYSDNYFNLI